MASHAKRSDRLREDTPMKSWQLVVSLCALALILGCSDSPVYESSAKVAMVKVGSPAPGPEELMPPKEFMVAGGGGGKLMDMGLRADEPAVPPKAMPLKIIRTGDIQVIVDNFDSALAKFKQTVDGIKDAYIAKAEIGGSSGQPRYGNWKARVPVAAFDSFMEQMAGLGVPERNGIDSRDVTEEFYDLDARLRNTKKEETRLVKHLETSTGKLEDILKVEHEISRVRGEIEQMEGRLRMLDNLATLTTVSVSIREIKNYVPPQSPTFIGKIQRTFSVSTEALVKFGELVVLFLVGLAPWSPLLAMAAVCIYGGVRLSRRQSGIKGPSNETAPTTVT